jgi:hypothetical protein
MSDWSFDIPIPPANIGISTTSYANLINIVFLGADTQYNTALNAHVYLIYRISPILPPAWLFIYPSYFSLRGIFKSVDSAYDIHGFMYLFKSNRRKSQDFYFYFLRKN